MKCVILAFLVIVAVAMAAPQGKKLQCVPLSLPCRQPDKPCCHNLECVKYANICVPVRRLIVSEEDKRPLGPGPYSSNVPKEELPQ